MNKPPYPGQGSPLPESMGVSGHWIFENVFFLADAPDVPTEEGATLTLMPVNPDGQNCLGFYVGHVAKGLGLTVPQLLEANKRGKLGISDQAALPARLSGKSALRLTFSFADRSLDVVVEAGIQIAGSA